MNIDKNNIDDLFKQHLEKEVVTFDKSAWNRAKTLLAPKRGSFGFVTYIIISLLFIGVISFFSYRFYNNSKSTNETSSVLTSTQNNPDKNLTPSSQKISALASSSIEEIDKILIPISPKKESAIMSANKTQQPISPFIQKTEIQDDVNKNGYVEYKSLPANAKIIEPKRTIPIENAAEVTPLSNLPITAKRQLDYIVLRANLPSPFYIFSAVEISSLLVSETHIAPAINKKQLFKFSPEIYYGIGLPLQAKNTTINQHGVLALKTLHSPSIGVGLKTNFKKMGFNLSVERQNYIYNQRISGYKQSQTYDTSIELITKNYMLNGKNFWIVKEKIDTTTTKSNKLETLSSSAFQITNIQIPLLFSYDFFIGNKFKLQPMLGIRLNYLKTIRGSLFYQNQEEISIKTKQIHTNWITGIEANYLLSQNFSMGLASKFILKNNHLMDYRANLERNFLTTEIHLRYMPK